MISASPPRVRCPGDSPDGLIGGMPQILLRAAELGRGAVGIVQWY